MKIVIAILLLLSISMSSFSVQANSGWTGYGNVIELIPTIHHRFKVNIDVAGNKSGCKEKQWFYQDYAVVGAEQMYLALLAAVSTNKTVRVYVTGRCHVNQYSEISEIGILP